MDTLFWVIEHRVTHKYRGRKGERWIWTSDINEAIWFVRRQDAEAIADGDDEDIIITEHAWK